MSSTENAVVERSHDPVGDAILPSLPKREPVIDLVEREKRPGGGGFGPQNRSIEEVEKRKNRFNGVGFGDPRRRSDSFETSMEDDEDEARPKIGGNKRGLQRPDNGGGG
ncbi:uncharacterized protein J4E84_010570 [Alternaria hordeiaustralica]|uniref:uncharacterized protein n=1 Tax=Alternaria hordeiaustralica TaxID=1187925 RepID=UPI0020C4ADFD|nr:uncharacterized protein J4E84_010570 [Alternaria hordeiaustralica]KAI4674332.1 hypothetical protein J4E84_010570 [Alternaria hordeiaustralica]